MFEKIIATALNNKLIVLLGTLALIILGIDAIRNISVDAVPDITNNQVQVVTTTPSLAAQEVEQFITYPLEIALANIPGVAEIRSISRFGLSVVTVVFNDNVPTLEARQHVKERIDVVRSEIPTQFGAPELMPITTGLGEVYQYVLKVAPAFKNKYSPMELRTIQDWIVKRQLAGTPGIVEISSFGGYLKQYEIAVDPLLLLDKNLTLADVFTALENNNANTGGSYIEKGPRAIYIRTEGLIQNLDDLAAIAVATRNGLPVRMTDIGKVGFGASPRFGALTMDGEGEAVGGIALMLKGENSYKVTQAVKTRMATIEKALPEGISIYPYLERTSLINRTIATVRSNLLEGGLIVILVLVLLLGNFRAGLVVASIIPLSLLFALIMMRFFGVSANLMSLGALDFGIVVDGAVIIVENLIQVLTIGFVGKTLTQQQMDHQVAKSAASIYKSAAFGVLIIMVVFIPVLSLTGIEGKMFRPMAQTVIFALMGALILSLTYVPVISALFLNKTIKAETGPAHRFMRHAENYYARTLHWAFEHSRVVIATSIALLVLALIGFWRMGAEFIPDLEEGDLAVQVAIQPGSSLSESIATAGKVERILKEKFPEVLHVVSKIGTAEVPTDPMAMEDMDVMVILKDKSAWTSAKNRQELVDLMKKELEVVLGIFNEFSQPIQLRFNELMTGAKTDIAIKIFGEDHEVLFQKANEAANLIEDIAGAADVKVEQTEGLPQLMIRPNRTLLARYGISIAQVNSLVQAAYAGAIAGTVYEGQRRFDLVVRLDSNARGHINLNELYLTAANGQAIQLAELVTVSYEDGPMQVSRENTQRRINIGVNVRNRDVASLVADIQKTLNTQLQLPPGYVVRYGGTFENLEQARERLLVAVPIALALIFVLLYMAFGQIKYVLMIGASVPFSAIGGIGALYLRGMPFSISAGIGFIALFGVAVLNGIVMISAINQLRDEHEYTVRAAVIEGARSRLRPVLMTGLVAALGFVPMALSSTAGAEVQKPLATVVIGGIASDTILTLLLLPIMYLRFPKRKLPKTAAALVLFVMAALVPYKTTAQEKSPTATASFTLEKAIDMALQQHPMVQQARIRQLQAAEERKKAVQLGQTEFTYQYGQLNALDYDNFIQINQSLGNPLAHVQRSVFAKNLLQLRASETALTSRELTLLVQLAWMEWLTKQATFAALERELEQLKDFGNRVNLQAAAGEISQLDQRVFIARLAQYDNLLSQERLLRTRAANDLRILTGFEGELLTETQLAPLPLPAFEAGLTTLFVDVAQKRLVTERKSLQVSKAGLFPEITAGYFNQEIERIPNFQGLMVGVRVPLWMRPQMAEIRQQQLQVQQATNDLRFEQLRRENERSNALAAVEAFRLQWERYGKLAGVQAATLQEAARLDYENGNTDFFRFFESVRTAIELQIESLQLLNQYNQAVLQYQFYTE